MKSIIYTTLLISSIAHGSTIVISNITGDPTDGDPLAILSNNVPLVQGEGSIAVGLFDSTASLVTRNDILSAFTQFGTTGAFNPEDLSFGSFDGGFFSLDITGPTIDTNSPFLNQIATFVIGDSSTLESSSSFAIFTSEDTFQPPPTDFLGSTTIAIDSNDTSRLILGEIVTFTPSPANTAALIDIGISPVPTQGINLELVPIPEPSSSVLIGLGSLALLSRRKR